MTTAHDDGEGQTQLDRCRSAVREDDRNPEAYIALAKCHWRLRQSEEAIAVLRQGLDQCAPSTRLHEKYIKRLEVCNRTEEAIDAAQDAIRMFPDDVLLKLREATLLPALYDTPSQLEHYRNRFGERLGRLSEELRLDAPAARQNALTAIGKDVFKYLGFQGRNDRELQVLYGGLVHRIMAANYPSWVQPLAMPPRAQDEKIRVAFVSSRFAHSSAMKTFGGWMRELDRKEFDVCAYHAAQYTDAVTGQVRQWCGCFRQLPPDLKHMANAIRADRPHIVVFLDHGVDGIMTQLAALRFAPVQCMAWDNPVTSGLPTVDYFLSGALMEPMNAKDHYSETLVCLPGVGACYAKPVIPTVLFSKTRRDFQIRDDAVAFLSGQSVFKHLPDQDEVYVRIARELPNSQFIFLVKRGLEHALQARLTRAFLASRLQPKRHVVLLPEQRMFDYWNLLQLSDMFLDTMGWSGGVSTMEAVACGVPVVTMPGAVMRGRQSYGILRQLGVTETIASDKHHYVEIAVRLGREPAWKSSVIERMKERWAHLYDDTRPARAMEELFRRAAGGTLQ